ncbi:MAG: 6-phosphogluconolactonase [Chloroflexi bacterium]|nr:6-phosphogluconolactonase [Chloroflexota bacterium]
MIGRCIVYPDLDRLSRAAAEQVAAALAGSDSARQCSIALAGGSTPLRLYALLASAPFADTLPWHRLVVYWGDERWVPHDHPESNYGAARRALLDRVPVPAHQVHPVPTDLPTPQASADAYEYTLREQLETRNPDPHEYTLREQLGPSDPIPRFDLILLGMGPDGHTASLFPGSPVLDECRRLVTAVLDAPKPPPARVTLTLPVLNAAARVIFLVAGADKAAALRAAILAPGLQPPTPGPQRPHAEREVVPPAGLVRPTDGELIWLVDVAAAGELPAAVPGWHVER